MPDNEIAIPIETDPRFKFERELNGSTKVFSLNHLPHVGLLSPNPKALVIPGMAFQMFNESSLDAINKVEVGDLVQVSCDPKHEIYKAWNPPAEYAIEEGFSRMYRIRFVTIDAWGFPVFIADEAL
jgi:hypothetical protein